MYIVLSLCSQVSSRTFGSRTSAGTDCQCVTTDNEEYPAGSASANSTQSQPEDFVQLSQASNAQQDLTPQQQQQQYLQALLASQPLLASQGLHPALFGQPLAIPLLSPRCLLHMSQLTHVNACSLHIHLTVSMAELLLTACRYKHKGRQFSV